MPGALKYAIHIEDGKTIAYPYFDVDEHNTPLIQEAFDSHPYLRPIQVEFQQGRFIPTATNTGSPAFDNALNANHQPVEVGAFDTPQGTQYQIYRLVPDPKAATGKSLEPVFNQGNFNPNAPGQTGNLSSVDMPAPQAGTGATMQTIMEPMPGSPASMFANMSPAAKAAIANSPSVVGSTPNNANAWMTDPKATWDNNGNVTVTDPYTGRARTFGYQQYGNAKGAINALNQNDYFNDTLAGMESGRSLDVGNGLSIEPVDWNGNYDQRYFNLKDSNGKIIASSGDPDEILSYARDPKELVGDGKPVIGTGAKVMGMVGLASLGLGFYSMFKNKTVDAQSVLTTAFGAWQTLTNVQGIFKSFSTTGILGIIARHPTAATIAAVAIIALVAFLASLGAEKDTTPGAGNAPNTSSPTQATSTPATVGTRITAWFDWLPSKSVFYFVPAVAALAIGSGILNLNPGSKNYQDDSRITNIEKTDLPAVTNTLQRNISGGTITGSLIGKVFVKKSADPGTTSDLAVFVSPDGSGNGKYTINKVSLNRAGYLTSPLKPDVSMIPFWTAELQTGTVSPNADAFNAVTYEMAVAEAANGGVSPESGVNALNKAAAANRSGGQ